MLKEAKKKPEMNPAQREFMKFFWISAYVLIITEVVVLALLIGSQIFFGSVGCGHSMFNSTRTLSRWWDLFVPPVLWICCLIFVRFLGWAYYKNKGETLIGKYGLLNDGADWYVILGSVVLGFLALMGIPGGLRDISIICAIWLIVGIAIMSLGLVVFPLIRKGYELFSNLGDKQ